VGEDERWRHLREFTQRWRSQSSLRAWIPFLFLEYDASAAFAKSLAPSIFVALDAPLEDRPDRPHLAAARDAAALLRGGELPTRLDKKLEQCFDELPDDGCILHLGLMLGRAAAGLRLSVLLPARGVAPYLRALGGADAAEAAERTLDLFPRWLAQAQLDFDFDPTVQGRVGFGVRPDQGVGDGWTAFLEALCNSGYCDEAKARALLSWPGCSNGLRRQLSHVKLVSEPSGIEAKAYFGAARVE
jgi:hypothetical protein